MRRCPTLFRGMLTSADRVGEREKSKGDMPLFRFQHVSLCVLAIAPSLSSSVSLAFVFAMYSFPHHYLSSFCCVFLFFARFSSSLYCPLRVSLAISLLLDITHMTVLLCFCSPCFYLSVVSLWLFYHVCKYPFVLLSRPVVFFLA